MSKSRRPQRLMEQLEDRILFDAVPDGDFLVEQTQEQPLFVQEQVAQAGAEVVQSGPRELILIDAGVENANALLDEILLANPDQSYEIRLLDADTSGIEQISSILEDSNQPYSAIHILSHGDDGSVHLGNSNLDASTLNAHAGDIALWSGALTQDADILLYGCNLAASEAGQEFVESLSQVTGADVAASDDITGHSKLGGDWELEYRVGDIDTSAFVAFEYTSVLAPPSIDLDADDSTAAGVDYSASFQPGGAPAFITDSDIRVSDVDGDDFSRIGLVVSGIEDGFNEFLYFNGDGGSSVSISLDVASINNKVTIGDVTYDIDFDGTLFTIDNDNGGNMTATQVEDFLRNAAFHTTSESVTQSRTFSFTVVDSGAVTSSVAQTTLHLDTDGDGVENQFDIDDDNDGILDINEGFTGSGSAGAGVDYDVDAQIVAGQAFAKGKHVQIGVNANGSFGASTANTPTGYVNISDDGRDDGNGLLGFISDTNKDGFSGGSYDGDYFTPGSPEEGFGVEIGGTNYNNNTAGNLGQISGSITGVDLGETADIFWNGSTSGLDVARKVSVNQDGLFIRMEVTLNNQSGGDLDDIYFMHNVDPDNDRSLHGDYATFNTIESQANESPSGLSLVTAQQNASGAGISGGTEETGSAVGLVSMDARSRVSFGGFANRTASDVYNATGGLTGTVGATATHDQAISLAFDIGTLAAGESTTIVYYYNMAGDPSDISDILAYESGTNSDNASGTTNELDHQDLDSDDDGIADNIEAQTTAGYIAASGVDADGDGLDDAFDQNIGDKTAAASVGLLPVDTDSDGIADVLDTDSDDDGVADIVESGIAPVTDATFADVNGSTDNPATDMADSFGSSELDYREVGADSDGDGIDNVDDLDDDNDGILDEDEFINPSISNWINPAGSNISASDGSIDFSYSGSTGWSTSIHSDNFDTLGYDDEFEFSFDISNSSSKAFMIGLNEAGTNSTASYTDIDHAIYFNGSTFYVYENGSYIGNYGTYSAGDTFSIEVDGTQLNYQRNGNTFLTRTITAGKNYFVDSSFHGSSSYPDFTLENINILPKDVTVEQLQDFDGDGIINSLDLDSDNDGIADNIEAQSTSGYIAPNGVYNDDGVDTAYAGLSGGGLTPVNTDGDSFADYLDTDSDNDGGLDSTESGLTGPTDASFSDVNGSIDDPTADLADSFGTSELDYREVGIDTDGDGIENSTDLDDDNDGILDSEEYSQAYVTNWFNQTGSNISTSDSSIEFSYTSGSGWSNSVHSDDISSFGYSDEFEFSFTFEGTGSKAFMIGLNESGTNSTASYTDIDHAIYINGTTLYVYENGSNRGNFGAINAGDTFSIEVDGTSLRYQRNGSTFYSTTITAGKDYYVDSSFNANSSHPDYSIDNLAITPIDVSAAELEDRDGDGVINSLDLDSDNDGISDLYESGAAAGIALDVNNDGTISLEEADAFDAGDGDQDDDGIMDVFEDGDLATNTGSVPVDTDGDGTQDYLDLDSDDDGIADTIEARPTAGYVAHADDGSTNVDSDGDGVLDIFDTNTTFGGTHGNFNAPVNTDSTGLDDFRDTDSDDDGILDIDESGLSSSDATATNADGSISNPYADLANDDNDASEVDYRSLGDFIDENENLSMDEDSSLSGTVLHETTSLVGAVTVTGFSIGGTNYSVGSTATIAGVGNIQINSDGSFTFMPNADYNGSVPAISYDMTDGIYNITSTLTITVEPTDDSFTDANETLSVDEDSLLTDSVLTGTSSVDGPVSIVDFTVDGSTYSAGDTATITGVGTLQINSDGTVSFVPDSNYNGSVPPVTYTVTDGSGTDVTSNLSITVDPVNDDFTDANESLTVDEDGSLSDNILTGTSSVDGPVTIADFTVGGTTYTPGDTATIPGVGTIQIDSDGTTSFTPVANYNGTVPTVTYTATDGSGADVASTLDITVNAINDDFTDANESLTVDEDGSLIDNILTGTSSVDGPVTIADFTVDGSTYSAGDTATIPGVGTIQIDSDGTTSFTPVANYNGTVPTVTYTATDGSGTDVTSTLDITVNAINDDFTDANESLTVDEDGSLIDNILTGTSSVDGPVTIADFTVDGTTYSAGDTATITGVGTIQIDSDGTTSFTPVANYNGAVPTVTYTVTDGSGTDVTSTLDITVNPANDDFTDANESLTVDEDGSLSDNILTGTSSVDGPVTIADFTVDGSTYSAGDTATIPGVGTIQIESDGTISFTPVTNYNGTVPTVTYTATDGSGTDVTSTLDITVNPVNDDFTDANESLTVDEDGSLIDNILTGTSSVDGPVSIVDFTVGGTTYSPGDTATIPGVGTIQIDSNGTTSFTPVANYNGIVPTVTYTATDGSGADVTSTLDITVNAVNDDFTDANESLNVEEDGSLSDNILTGTSSVDGPVTIADFTVDGSTYSAGDTATITGVGTLQIKSDGTISFTPVANYNGTVPTVTYTATDGSGTDVTSTLDITVNPVNDDFTDANESLTVDEDGSLIDNVLTGTSSIDGPVAIADFTVDGTTYSPGDTATIPGVGTIQIDSDGTTSFTPVANYNGTVPTVTYTATDGSGADVTSTLDITVNAVNDDFTDANESLTVDEDGSLSDNILTGTSSVDGPVTIADFTVGGTTYTPGDTATIPGVGTIQIDSDGTTSFTPVANYNGTVPTVTYTATDGSGTDVTSTLDITVNAVNDDFTDANESLTVDEDGSLSDNILTGTSSVDGPVSIVDFTIGGTTYTPGDTATIPGVGTIQIDSDGTTSFTPVANYNGTVPTVTYTATDGSGTDVTSTLDITVNAINDDFTDANESLNVDEDGSLIDNILTGTSSVDGPVTIADFTVGGTTYSPGDTATISGVGTFQIESDGTISFTPVANYNGTVPTVTYTATDGSGADVTSTLDITVNAVNDDFTDANESLNVEEDGSLIDNILTGTSSVDGPVTIADFTVGGTTYSPGDTATISGVGTFQIESDGTISFTPVANYNGTVPTVTYTATDGSGADVTSTLDITVNPVNDDFTDANESLTVDEDGSLSDNILTGTSSVDGPVTIADLTVDGTTYSAGDTATITGVGTLQINSDGTISFTPVANYNGTVPTVTYTATDGSGTDVTSTLDITVNAVDDGFTDANESLTVDEDGSLSDNILTGTSSVDGPVSIVDFTVGGTTYSPGDTATIPGVGTIQIDSNGTVNFTPVANYNGTVPTVTYTATDGSGTDVTSTLDITVNAVNDDFTDANESLTVDEDGSLSDNILTGTSSVDGPVSIVDFTIGGTTYTPGDTATIPGVGTIQIDSDGTTSFTPVANYNGTVPTVTYTATDGSGTDVTSTLDIAVNAVNDDFTDANESLNVDEDGSLIDNILTGTSSVDGPVTIADFTVGGTTYSPGDTATIPGVGTIQIDNNGTVNFTPVANYNGTVPTVTYTATDGSGTDVTSTLDITVNAVDDGFTDANESLTVDEDGSLFDNILTGTSSVDGPVSIVDFTVGGTTYSPGDTATIPGVGTIQIDSNGTVNFTPVANYNGTVPTVTYTATDGSGTDVTSTLDITVNAVNDDFTDANESLTVDEDGSLSDNILTGTSSVDGPVSIVDFTIGGTTYTPGDTATIPGVGTIQIDSDGTTSFTPVANYNGTVPTVTYTATDGSGTDVTSTLDITVNAINDDFTDANESLTVDEDGSLIDNILTGTSSVDGPVTIADFTVGGTTYSPGDTATIPGVGTIQIDNNGTVNFTPVANYNGTVPTVTYTATDGSGADVTSTLDITVNAVNDDFTDANESLNVDEDGSLIDNILTGTSSVDGPVEIADFTVGGTTYSPGDTATIPGVGTIQIDSDGTTSFTPVANYNGAVPTVTYTVTDGSGTDVTSTLDITVNPVNDDFTDANESLTVDEDGSLIDNILTGTSGVDGPVTIADFTVGGTTYSPGDTATIPGVGTIQIDSDGTTSFTPVANYNGAVPTVTYTVTDGSGTDVTSTLDITVNAINDDFTDANESLTVDEDGSLIDNILTGTSSVDGPVTIADFTVGGTTYTPGDTATIPGVGTIQIDSDGTTSFTPVANYNGTVPTVTYTATDGSGTDVTSNLSITVDPVNDDFTDANESLNVDEDGSLSDNILTGTSSVDGPVSIVDFTVDASTYSAGDTATITGVGTLQINSDGTVSFVPDSNYNGSVPPVTYTATDGSGADVTSTLDITVNPVNDDFTDVNESLTVDEDGSLIDNVLTGTSSIDGPVAIADFTVGGTTYSPGDTATIPGVGTIQIDNDGSLNFTPVANYNGTVPTATYTATDGSGTDVTSTLDITVNPVNDDFTDVNESLTVDEDGSLSDNILTGTSSVDGPVTIADFTVDGTTYSAGDTATITGVGTLQINSDGTISFTPVANYNGTVPTVTYTATDGSGTDVTSTLDITVNAVDDGFTDANESLTVDEDGSLFDNILTGTSSVDGPVSIVDFTVGGTTYTPGDTATIPGVGTIQIDSNGTVNFTPVANYNGTVPTVTYTATDGSGTDVTSTLDITVNAVNDDFTDVNESLTVDEDGSLIDNILTGTSSVDGPVTIADFTIGGTTYSPGETATIPGVGTIQIDSDGTVNFTPVANYNGTVPTVTYTATDGSGTDVTSTLDITVNPINDDFTDANESLTVDEDGSLIDNILTGTSSVDGPVTIADFTVGGTTYTPGDTATTPGVGTIQIDSDGTTSFTPVANYNGAVPTVTYTVTDGSGTDATSALTINVNAQNDQPITIGTISDQSGNDSDSISGFDISRFFDDIDGDDLTFTDAGTLPDGLTIDPNTGTISGIVDSSASQSGPFAVTVTATDANGQPASQSFEWTFSNVAPIANSDINTISEDTTVPIVSNVITTAGAGHDTDGDGDVLVIDNVDGITVTGSTEIPGDFGTLTIHSDGTYSYELDNNSVQILADGESARESFAYILSDGEGGTDTAQLVVDVLGANDAPTINGTVPNQLTQEGEPIAPLDVSEFISDIDGTDALTFDDNGTLPPGLTIHPITGVVTGSVDLLAAGDGPFAVEVTATDPQGEKISVSIQWEITPFYRFDSFHDIANEWSDSASTDSHDNSDGNGVNVVKSFKREVIFSKRIQSLAPEPILAGAARPGTVLVGRIYAADGTIIAEATDTANSAGNWIMNFNDIEAETQVRVVIEHIATEESTIGDASITLASESYRSLQLGTVHTESLTAGSILSSRPFASVKGMGQQNINPLDLLSGDS